MKLVKYFLSKKPVTILLLVLVLAGGLLAYVKMGKLEDAPFTIKQALVLTPYPGASPSEVQSQVTDVLEESIQALGELYYLKTENPCRTVQNHRLCKERNPCRRNAATLGQTAPHSKRRTEQAARKAPVPLL